MSELNTFLIELDKKTDQTQSYKEIEQELLNRFTDDTDLEIFAEKIAFSLLETDRNNSHGWGTLYGPQLAFYKEDKLCEWPNREQITEEIIEYWIKRSEITNNHYIKARYLGLINEFYEMVMLNKLDFRLRLNYIESLIDCCEHKIGKQHEIRSKCEQAYYLAKKFNQPLLKKRAIKAAIELEKHFSNGDINKIDGFSFELLILSKEKEIEEADFEKVLQNFHQKFDTVKNFSHPSIIQEVGLQLISYYRSQGDNESVDRVVEEIAFAIKKIADISHAVIASTFYHDIHKLYTDFDKHDKAALITIDIKRVGKELLKYMVPIQHTTKIPIEEYQQTINQLTEGTFDAAIYRIQKTFIISRSDIIKQLHVDSSNQGFFTSLFANNRLNLDDKGIPANRLQGVEDDLEGNIIEKMKQLLHVSSLHLTSCFDKIFSDHKITSETLTDYLYQSPIFCESKKQTIAKAMKLYFSQEHEIFAYLIIPQIEAAFRLLLETIGEPVLRANRHGGFQLITIDDLIRNPHIKTLFGEDCVTYFRVVLSETRGWNLRNRVCHGIVGIDELNKITSNLLLHILIILSQTRINTN